jgi:hypothetical protein
MAATLLYIESIIYPDYSLDPSPERLPPRQTLSTQAQSACPPRDDLGGFGDIEGKLQRMAGTIDWGKY